MDPSAFAALAREALRVALAASAAPLLAALAVGLATGVLQAATQVQDPSAAVALRLAAVLGALGFAGPWSGAQVARFAASCLELSARAGR
jgi:type III secretory pathway component EscS